MTFNYNGYLRYKLPSKWCAQQDEDNLILFDPNGQGAIVISFFNVLNTETSLVEYISIFTKKFVDQNKITLNSPLIVFERNDKTILNGTGITSDGWFIKLWAIVKFPRIVFSTYQSRQKSKEINMCDTIVDSFEIIDYEHRGRFCD